MQAFGQETRHALLKEACWHRAEGRLEALEEHPAFHSVCFGETLLFFHSFNNIQCTPHKSAHSTTIMIMSLLIPLDTHCSHPNLVVLLQ